MRAIVFHSPHDVRVESVPDAGLRDARSAVVRVTCASICGSDLHPYEGAVPSLPGTVMGHECVGVVEEVGSEVRRFRKGDRVIVPAVVGCGDCPPCRKGYAVGCRTFAFKVFGVVPDLPGAQAEAIAVPHADANLLASPSELADEQVLFLTDILPTGYFAAQNAALRPGDVVAVVGCGPVGLLAIASAQLFGPARIVAIDRVPYRLERARVRRDTRRRERAGSRRRRDGGHGRRRCRGGDRGGRDARDGALGLPARAHGRCPLGRRRADQR